MNVNLSTIAHQKDMAVNNIAAIIVTYYPTEVLLRRLLLSVCNEAGRVYIVDNTPAADVSWMSSHWLLRECFDANYQSLGDNLGIAKAQNVGIDAAIKDGYDHVIFFDQDSAPPKGMVQRLLAAEVKLLAANIKVGSVGPLFLDEKTGHYSRAIRHQGLRLHKIEISDKEAEPVAADYLIASGSLIRVSVLQEAGLMREELFIDWVDIEWGLRAASFGCKHFIVPDAVMLHSIGDEFVSIGKTPINLHNDVRNYYIVRNACHLLLDSSVRWQWRLNILFKIPKYVIFYSLTSLSKNRTRAFRLLIRACFDGFSGQLGKAF